MHASSKPSVANLVQRESLYLGLYLTLQSRSLSFWFQAIAVLLILGLTAIAVILFRLFLLILVKHHVFIPSSNNSEDFLGRPMIFPVTIKHVRLSPIRNQFKYQALFIGIPVGLRGRIGNLLSVDESPDSTTLATRSYSWRGELSKLDTWFRIDSSPYLHRGDTDLDLKQKLDKFLIDKVVTTLSSSYQLD